MPSNATSICVPCRHVTKTGASCPKGHELQYMGKRWRAPKRGNDLAWKRIAAGHLLWDRRVVERWPWRWGTMVKGKFVRGLG